MLAHVFTPPFVAYLVWVLVLIIICAVAAVQIGGKGHRD